MPRRTWPLGATRRGQVAEGLGILLVDNSLEEETTQRHHKLGCAQGYTVC